jgi:hypothetical protein
VSHGAMTGAVDLLIAMVVFTVGGLGLLFGF